MAPDTGPNDNTNQNDEYLTNVPPYNYPDPSSDEDEEEEEDEGDFIGNDGDSDNGGGGDNMAGYQLLNQEGGEDNGDRLLGREVEENQFDSYSQDNIDSENHQHDTNPINLISSNIPIADLPPPPVDEITKQLDTVPRVDIELDEVKIDQIKQAMSGFNLPSSSIPGWASVVTEDQLANFIHCKTKSNQSH